MKRFTRPLLHIVMLALAVALAAHAAKAQGKDLDPVKVDPEHYKVLYEDANVRVLRYDDTPGHFVPKHTHKYPYKVFVVTDAAREFLALDGQQNCLKTAAQTKLVAGEELTHAPTTHCESNTGTTDTHLIIVEFKKPPAAKAGRRRR